jgi:hypothetical protein
MIAAVSTRRIRGPSPTGTTTTATVTIHVNNSPKEITDLVMTFLDDFVHTDRSPAFCVRNFSNSCSGKAAELSDIEFNRANFTQDPTRSSFSVSSITFDQPAKPTFSTVLAPCHFAATNKTTGVFGIANGTCRLTTVYENWQWYLCDSNFLSNSFTSAMRFFRF